ncbi:hypothetical protein CPC735_038570 [Coccidioides posadasii C735 delta SOWgp]|uniref:Inositolphosphotransferase Aur1/Ipt1 domain-containing protein n=1 Tax=Coccidioides posadasii (strain C735) TaxID=222929 RepID=C5P2Q5_COCP7|nr:hypothetical protein CPC735_038570 [Coccidioides posadasii C735 delta SOWgp]EER28593.1 hypothetical protein CPC735_038570 [Coccidioides posadasii C735 delta SOWgp]|eukprot:XP_003070738.1 hypothetical protein CPC735_038570 [Coccidioides posadasii C735 delta SOWgp]
MGAGAFLEPLVVVTLLFGGTWINRERDVARSYSRNSGFPSSSRDSASSDQESDPQLSRLRTSGSKAPFAEGNLPRSHSPSLLTDQEHRWRKRNIGLFSWETEVITPNTAVFKNRLLSRLLHKFPFLVECWYWALVYWIYQLGRAFTAVTLQAGTVDVARRHALQIIELEERLHIFWEIGIQKYFLQRPLLLMWTNWVYSFIHIPGTIAFLVWLYYYNITRNRQQERWLDGMRGEIAGSPAGPALYQARRRTMAVCNLLAFVVFTLWPCMPPRLLSDENVEGPIGEIARSYGFVDTVHGTGGASSVWTQNRFCNQYAAMPSLHFGYSLMIGLTIMTIPLAPQHRRSGALSFPLSDTTYAGYKRCFPSWHRLACLIVGFAYPFTILVAIVATANHFILDAVAGAFVCGLGWWGNSILLNLLPIEDYFLWALRIHKPEHRILDVKDLLYNDVDDDIATPGARTR